MPGRGFLLPSQDDLQGSTEFHWRSAAVNAYYAIFLECRHHLLKWGFQVPSRDSIHSGVRLRFTFANDRDMKAIGDVLDELVRLRNRASYDMKTQVEFNSTNRSAKAIQDATRAIGILDQIEKDPIRRTASIRSIVP